MAMEPTCARFQSVPKARGRFILIDKHHGNLMGKPWETMGKPWQNGDLYGKSPSLIGKSTISMGHFQ